MTLSPDLTLNIWLGAIPLVAGVGAYGLVLLGRRIAAYRRELRRRARRRLLARAGFGVARVHSLRVLAAGGGVAQVDLRLDVRAYDGDYPAAARWSLAVAELHRLEPGQEVPVLVLAVSPRRVCPNVVWACAAGQTGRAPARQLPEEIAEAALA